MSWVGKIFVISFRSSAECTRVAFLPELAPLFCDDAQAAQAAYNRSFQLLADFV